MALTHLDDNQIQEYLDGTTRADRAEIAAHLESCSMCRAKVREYELLYSGLAEDAGFDLAPDFAATVAARVMPQPEVQPAVHRRLRFRYSDFILAACALGAVIAAVIYFVDLPAIFNNIHLKLAGSKVETTVVSAYRGLLSEMGVKSQLVLSAVAVLLTFTLFDRLIRVVRHGKAMFFA